MSDGLKACIGFVLFLAILGGITAGATYVLTGIDLRAMCACGFRH